MQLKTTFVLSFTESWDFKVLITLLHDLKHCGSWLGITRSINWLMALMKFLHVVKCSFMLLGGEHLCRRVETLFLFMCYKPKSVFTAVTLKITLQALYPSTCQFEEQFFVWRLIHILSHRHEDISTNKLMNDLNICTHTLKCDGFSFTLYHHFSCFPVHIPVLHDTVSPCLCCLSACGIHTHNSVKRDSKDFLKGQRNITHKT